MKVSICVVLVVLALAWMHANGAYTFQQFQQIKSTTPGVNNFFGWSMSLDKTNTYLAVGAPLASVGGSNTFRGLVNVYQRPGSGVVDNNTISWQSSGVNNTLTNGIDPQTYDFLGQAVFVGWNNVTNDVMVAAYALRGLVSLNREGGVYLFSRQHSPTPSANAWVNNAGAARTLTAPNGKLSPITPAQPYRFGEALTGDLARSSGRNPLLIVGEFRYQQKVGRVHVYTYVTGTGWSFNSTMNPPNSQIFNSANSGYGISLSLNGDLLAVGSSGAQLNRGAVHVYRDTSPPPFTSFTLLQSVRALDGVSGDQYGWSVSITSEWLAIGANRRSDCGTACGGVYMNYKDTGASPTETLVDGWGQLVKVTAQGLLPGAQLGSSVDVDGDFMVAGAPSASFNNVTDQTGAVYVFQRNTGTNGFYAANGWGQVGYFSKSPLAARDRLGRVVQSFSPHLLASSMLEDTTASNSGAVYYFKGDTPFGGVTGNPPVLNATNGTSTTGVAASTTAFSGTSTLVTAGSASMLQSFFF